MTPGRLGRIARHHLDRYATTRAHLRRLLVRRIDRALERHGGDREVLQAALDSLLDTLESEGLLDDARFAHDRAATLHRRGLPVRAIRGKLREKGVPPTLVAEAVEDKHDLRAACTWVRKRRAGRFRDDPEPWRERDLARMARAGFSYDVARRVLASPPEELEELETGDVLLAGQ